MDLSQLRQCPECGTAIEGEVAEGLCAACLLRLALNPSGTAATFQSAEHVGPPVLNPLVGHKLRYFGDYELLEEIARGGMGIVYRARQLSLNRIVAVKMLRPGQLASEEQVQRFLAEAEAVANLRHPNIVAIHEVGEYEGLHYFSMDYIEGRNLAEVIRTSRPCQTRAAAFTKTIAEAVHFAHEHGTLHRDLKPANILVDASDQPHITDFGLARRFQEDSHLTVTGIVVGTPAYMAPEQAEGTRSEIGPQSDVYSLGAILYELITGRPPFQAETGVETIRLAQNSQPIAPRRLKAGISRDLETICLKCLEKDPRRRYATARELAEDVDRFLSRKPVAARRSGVASRTWRWCRRNPWKAVAAFGLFLLAGLGTMAAITLRERLWHSLLDQARVERMTGNRRRSLELIARAARLKASSEVRQEAVQTIISPAVDRLQEIPFGGTSAVAFSPDSRLIAVSGFSGVLSKSGNEVIGVYDAESGHTLGYSERERGKALSFVPNTQSVIIPRSGDQQRNLITLWDPASKTIEDITIDQFGRQPVTWEKVQLSPNGRYLVGEAFFWGAFICFTRDLVTGREIRKYHASPLGFLGVDDLLIRLEGRVSRLNLTTEELVTYSPKGFFVSQVSRSGRIAALRRGSEDKPVGPIVLWDMQADRELRSLTVGDDKVEIILSESGSLAAVKTSAEPNVINLYEMTPSETIQRKITLAENGKLFFDYKNSIQASFSPDGTMLAVLCVAGSKGSVSVFDTETGNEIGRIADNHSPVWSPNSSRLATRGPGLTKEGFSSKTSFGDIEIGNAVVNVWSAVSPSGSYLDHGEVGSLAFSPDGSRLFSTGAVWNVLDNGGRLRLQRSSEKIVGNHRFISSGGRLWDVSLGDYPIKIKEIDPNQREVVLKDPGYFALIKESYPNLGLPEDQPDRVFGRIRDIAFSPNGESAVIATDIWWKNVDPGLSPQQLEGTTLELWDLRSAQRVAKWLFVTYPNFYDRLCFSPDARLVSASRRGEVAIFDVATEKYLRGWYYRDGSLSSLLFGVDSKHIFVGLISYERPDKWLVTVNDVETRLEVGAWHGHQGAILVLALSPDGRTLASAGEDHTVRLWDAATGRELAVWEAHKGAVTALAFSPDSQTLVSGSSDGSLKTWSISFIRTELGSLGLGW